MKRKTRDIRNIIAQIPIWVKFIAYINFGIAILLLIFGAFFGLTLLATPNLLGFVGLVFSIAFAMLYFFIGRGLLKGQNWARIVVIIFVALDALGVIFNAFEGNYKSIFILPFFLIVGGYLLFSSKVKKAFSK